MYKFCKANGSWWFVCQSIDELLEYKDKTNNKYGLAILNSCKGTDSKYKKLYEAAESLAMVKQISVVEAMAELSGKITIKQVNELSAGKKIWFNNVGGWNTGLTDIDATTYMSKLIFPNCKKEDIKISKFGGYEGGKHYYAKIGEIEICEYANGKKIVKWNTYQDAYNHALKYCEEI